MLFMEGKALPLSHGLLPTAKKMARIGGGALVVGAAGLASAAATTSWP
jgi:hypothetical protein